jgi:hypothetical protein
VSDRPYLFYESTNSREKRRAAEQEARAGGAAATRPTSRAAGAGFGERGQPDAH